MVSCNLYNFYWVQIDMNHALPHSLMMLPLPRFIYTSQKKRQGMNHYESYTKITLIFSLQFFRDDHSEYEDHMDISKLILKDPLEKQVTLASSSFSPKGIIE